MNNIVRIFHNILLLKMNIVYNYISAFIFLTSAAVSYEAQILAIVPIYGQSHWNVMDAVLQTLVSAGHNLTVFTPFVKKEKITNYTQVRYRLRYNQC